MKFIKFKSFFLENEEFNNIVNPLLEDFFSPEKIGEEGYLHVLNYEHELVEIYSDNNKLQREIFVDKEQKYKDKEFPENLKGYERTIASRIFYGNMINYMISGPMGSGKSSTMDFIINNLESHSIGDNSVFIKLDFNENYDSSNIDVLMEFFLDDLYHKLRVKIINTVSRFKIANEFLKNTENDTKFSKFYNLYFKNIYMNDDVWNAYDEREKIFSILQYIDDNAQRKEQQVDLLMRFLNFLGGYIEKKKGRFIIFYDNIDKLPPVAQLNILAKIFSYNKIAKVKKIIAIRRSTKAKLDKYISRQLNSFISGRSQTVYGHIFHYGPSPRRVYLRKLEYLINNINTIELFNSINQEYIDAISKRAIELKNELSNKKSEFSQALYCTAGESKRLGLTLVQRNFCNHIYPYNANAQNSNEICRTLYIGNNSKNMMMYNDKYIANIFANNEMEFSLINYLLFSMIKFENEKKKASYYYYYLYENFEFSDSEIIDAFNYLLHDKRALIRGEYFPHYVNSDELMRIDDVLRVTELGDRYFNNLYLEGSIYTQSCLFSLKWSFGSDYIVEDGIINRASLLRQILKEVKEIEDYRFELYDYNIDVMEVEEYTFESVVKHLTYLHYSTFYGVIKSFKINKEKGLNELKEWVDMVNFWSYEDDKYDDLLLRMKQKRHTTQYNRQ